MEASADFWLGDSNTPDSRRSARCKRVALNLSRAAISSTRYMEILYQTN
jgi:hypothetical protein